MLSDVLVEKHDLISALQGRVWWNMNMWYLYVDVKAEVWGKAEGMSKPNYSCLSPCATTRHKAGIGVTDPGALLSHFSVLR